MPTKLTKPITRETDSSIFQVGSLREIVVSIEPVKGGALIGFRLKGTRDTYKLPVGSLFVRAVEHHLQKIEREAKRLIKAEGLTARSAKARAKKSLGEKLR